MKINFDAEIIEKLKKETNFDFSILTEKQQSLLVRDIICHLIFVAAMIVLFFMGNVPGLVFAGFISTFTLIKIISKLDRLWVVQQLKKE